MTKEAINAVDKEHNNESPFHRGEQIIQARTGKRQAIERFGRHAVRSYMPDQHREFFPQLPFIVVGAVDDSGWPWATLLSGKPGFVESPTPTSLVIDALFVDGDPVAEPFKTVGSQIGVLGIEMPTRRRNRVNVRVSSVSDLVELKVDQSFGNCPQYIQARDIVFVREPGEQTSAQETIEFTSIGESEKASIETADSFFVASFINTELRPDIEGVDVSHRGGMPGFVKVEGNTLTIPDYPGNFLFNTLGNFLLNPKAGLVFPDFKTGDLLMLTGRVEILWEDHPEIQAFKGAERGWRLTVEQGKWLKDALPFRARFKEYSPNSTMTGTWQQAEKLMRAQAQRDNWQPVRVIKIEQESSVITSFYLQHAKGAALLPFNAGQYLTLKIQADEATEAVRTYTLSSAPHHDYYRISVKKENHGGVSRFLHEHIAVGDVIDIKAPAGDFVIDIKEKRPAVLLAGGVGITPMIAMAEHLAYERVRSRASRTLTIFHAAKTTEQRAFCDEFRALEKATSGAVKYYSFVSKPLNGEQAGIDFNGTGHLSADVFRQTLALDDYDFYLCGPASFMQAIYDALRSLGINDSRIFAEAFGPASLVRVPDQAAIVDEVQQEADLATVKFSQSGFEQAWNKGDGTLLEVAEEHGLTPQFGCRSGSCGSCAVSIKTGDVTYRSKPTATIAENQALICCAVPAQGTKLLELDL